MFQITNKQYLSSLFFNILEEISLFNIFELEDFKNIYNLAYEKYSKLYEITKVATQKFSNESEINIENNFKNEKKNDLNYVFSDICEYKACIISLISTNYTLCLNYKNISIAPFLYKVKNLFF